MDETESTNRRSDMSVPKSMIMAGIALMLVGVVVLGVILYSITGSLIRIDERLKQSDLFEQRTDSRWTQSDQDRYDARIVRETGLSEARRAEDRTDVAIQIERLSTRIDALAEEIRANRQPIEDSQ